MQWKRVTEVHWNSWNGPLSHILQNSFVFCALDKICEVNKLIHSSTWAIGHWNSSLE
jgi:hypothetical protein